MSGYPNGQPYRASQSYSGQYTTPYTISNTGQQSANQSSNFNAGDDPNAYAQGQQGQQQYYGYNQSQPQQYASPQASSQPSLPYRSQSQLGGYQHQTQQPYQVNQGSHSTYDPSQYQQQNVYNPQQYGSSAPGAYGNTGYQSGYQSTYQPYVPAAYTSPSTATQGQHSYAGLSPSNQYGTTYQQQQNERPHLPQSPVHSYPSDASHGYAAGYSNYLSMPSPPAPAPPPHQDTLSPARPYSHSISGTYGQYQDTPNLSSQSSSDVRRNHSGASHNSGISNTFTPSPQPSSSGVPSRHPSHSGQASNVDRHPQGRTLPGLPSESESDNEYYPQQSNTGSGLDDDLINDINAQLNAPLRAQAAGDFHRDPLFAPTSPQLALSPDEKPTHNGILSTGDHNINYGAFANDSDAEAAAGLAAMQAADEQEAAEEERRRSGHFYPGQGSGQSQQYSDRERSDESDYAGYGDLSLAGGGYAGTMHYGDDPHAMQSSSSYQHEDRLNPRMSSMRSSGMSSDGQISRDATPGIESQSFPHLPPGMAQVDAGGTGGLTEPASRGRRMSFEDGDEATLSEYGDHDAIPDLFFHPGMSPNRPLPPPPARSGSDAGSRLSAASTLTQNRYSAYDQLPRLYPPAPDAYNNDALSPSMVPRSTSLASTQGRSRPEQPMRAKTDAQARLMKQQGGKTMNDGFDLATPKTDMGSLDLPAIPRKKLDPSKISAETYKKCSEPWSMSAVFTWIRSLADEETDLKENTLTEAISGLFCHKVPTMNTIEAEALAQQVIKDMYNSHVLIQDEEWVKFAPGSLSGVMYQLTGLGCYSPKLHLQPEGTNGRCYSYHCMRTVKKVDFSISSSAVKAVPWNEFWSLTAEQCNAKGKKELERQFNLREVVYGEDAYLFGLDLLRTLYRDRLAKSESSIIPSKKKPLFLNDVFGLAEKVKKVNEDYLAPQLKYREKEQGPWVVGFSDIFREWIRRARPLYVEYASKYPRADELIREESRKNVAFHAFLEAARSESVSQRLGWDNWLKQPIQRMQRYILLLETVMKNSIQSSEEKTNLAFAIDELKATAHEMDVRVNEVNKELELQSLAQKLRLRKYSGDEIDLALDHLGRAIILRNDLMRQGGKGVSWVPCQAILFDHYLVLAKPGRDAYGNDVLDVSKPPIHMGLISLESTDDPPVTKSTVRGTTAVVAPRGVGPDPKLNRMASSHSGGTLVHTNTGLTAGSGASGNSVVTASVHEPPSDGKDDKIYYPFKVKHLGRSEVYTLFALSQEKRREWCEAIIGAKTQHAEALYAQNAEPFRLRVLADTAFGTETINYGPKRVVIRGTPIDRAVKEVEKRYAGQGRPAPICRSAVNCATVFHQPAGRVMCAIGTDSGVYISEYQNPRGWVRVSLPVYGSKVKADVCTQSIQMQKVTQLAVLEEFNLLIILSDKVLIAYHLDVVCPPNGPPVPQADSSARKAPQRLSGSKDVGFFLAGKMKDRVLVFYQKREGINSIFKILEPVLQKSATSRSRWLGNSSRRGQTEFFREYDEFYIPAETYSLNMFHSSLAVATKRGMEVLTLDKKITWGVPNLESDTRESKAYLVSIAARLKDLRPLGMFRLSEAEFLVAFSECAVYVNKLGDISRSVIMEFVGRANYACLYYPYLILFNDDFVEIRDAQNGRMKQVIAGKDIHMLDDGGNAQPGQGQGGASLGGGANGLGVQGYNTAPKTVKLSMQHPEYDKSYVVVEMVMRTEQQ